MDVYLKDYLYLARENNASLAVIEALNECKKHENVTLKLGGGTLHFFGKFTFEKEYYISNNDYSRKNIVFPIIGFKNFTIDGEGADLNFHGQILPFVIDDSENIILKNFTVDYPYPFFFQAKITSATEKQIELTFDRSKFCAEVQGRSLMFSSPDGWRYSSKQMLNCEFDASTMAPSAYIPPYIADFAVDRDSSFLSGMHRYLTPTQISENVIVFDGDFGHKHTVGNYFVCTFGDRKNPGIFANGSKNLAFEDVTLYSTASMGVVCQLCENVYLHRLNTVPRENSGRMLSVNADSTHFVNCTGFVKYENCKFTNMLDDAGNCHGIYAKFVRKINNNTMLLTFGHNQQQGMNIFDAGDKIRIVDNMTMQAVTEVTVKSSELISAEYLRLEVCEGLPEMTEGFGVENFTKMPELYIYNCETGNNRPRGFLTATWRKCEIIGNTFYNMMCGVSVSGDCNDWFESGATGDILIRNNNFKNSSYTGGTCITFNPAVKEGDKPYHRNVTIENNVFELAEKRFLYAANVENLIMRNNKFVKNESLPVHGECGENGVSLKNCVNVQIEIM